MIIILLLLIVIMLLFGILAAPLIPFVIAAMIIVSIKADIEQFFAQMPDLNITHIPGSGPYLVGLGIVFLVGEKLYRVIQSNRRDGV